MWDFGLSETPKTASKIQIKQEAKSNYDLMNKTKGEKRNYLMVTAFSSLQFLCKYFLQNEENKNKWNF